MDLSTSSEKLTVSHRLDHRLRPEDEGRVSQRVLLKIGVIFNSLHSHKASKLKPIFWKRNERVNLWELPDWIPSELLRSIIELPHVSLPDLLVESKVLFSILVVTKDVSWRLVSVTTTIAFTLTIRVMPVIFREVRINWGSIHGLLRGGGSWNTFERNRVRLFFLRVRGSIIVSV